jgi:hypothetical protein
MALQAIKFTLNTARNIDPTRTLVLRGQFVAQVNKRFRALKEAINQLLTKDNFLDPVKPTEYQPGIIPIGLAAKYEYMRSDVKVDQFMEWLKDQEGQGILEIIQRPGGLRRGQSQAWSDTYIRSSYSKGIAQGRADLRKLGADIPNSWWYIFCFQSAFSCRSGSALLYKVLQWNERRYRSNERVSEQGISIRHGWGAKPVCHCKKNK